MSDRAGTRDLRACARRLASCVVVAVACTAMRVESRGLAADEVAGGGWRAGVAVVRITPERPLPMAGYAGRKEPAEGTEQDLFAKAIALDDGAGGRTVWITLDLIGVTAELREAVARRVEEAVGLAPAALLINASHTHCGPEYVHADAADYRRFLEDALVELADRAIAELAPATVAFGSARAAFAMNRRTPTRERFLNHPNPSGPVDHAVPVLGVRDAQGGLRGLVFGYACHNTTMGFRRWLGDYAGYAQRYLEEDHPGVTALFMMGCGGDQNPYPRSELKYAERHGRTLATAVEAAIEVNQNPPRHQRVVSGAIRTALETIELPFTDTLRPPHRYPVQVIRLGDAVLLVALGMEATVDYALRIKTEFVTPDGPAVWVAGYSNDYPGYVPSRRVLLEGGYEAESRPWDPGVEERIIAAVHRLADRTRSPTGTAASR